jgi:hypothetical protein
MSPRVLEFLYERHRSGSSYRPARRMAFAQPFRRGRPADCALRRPTHLVPAQMIRTPNFRNYVAANQATELKLPSGRASCDVLAAGHAFARVKSMKHGDSPWT